MITPTVREETETAWGVECQGPDCRRIVWIPKRVALADGTDVVELSGPTPRGCIDHPPSTWEEDK